MPIFIVCMVVLCLLCPSFIGFISGIATFFAVCWVISKAMGA